MKFNVLGFYQPKAVELGLSADDLLVLRWFVDYAGTNKMRTMVIENQIYYWVNYATVLQELPILNISKQTLYKKNFTNLCKANVLVHKQIKDGGNFSYYCYGINYDALLYLQDAPLVKNEDLVSNSTKGCVKNEQTLVSNSTEQRLYNNKIILQDNNTKELNKKDEQSSIIGEFDFSQQLIAAISTWLDYKKEKHQTYKSTGLKILLNRLWRWKTANGDQYVIDAIESSIASNYTGIFPAKENKQNQKSNFIDNIKQAIGEMSG